MLIQGSCGSDAPAEGIIEHKIQGAELGQFIAQHAGDAPGGEMGSHPVGCQSLPEQVIIFQAIGYHGNIGNISSLGSFAEFQTYQTLFLLV